MNKTLRWYVEGGISKVKTEVGGKHTLDTDYRPVRVNMMARIAGDGTTIIDINDDGATIFDDKPALGSQTEKTWTTIPRNVLRKDSIITLDIDQIPDQQGCRDLTVELELEEI